MSASEITRAVEAYYKVKDTLDAETKQFNARAKDMKDTMAKLVEFIDKEMGDLQSVKTSAGTPFRKEKDAVKVVDSEAFFRFVLESENIQLLKKDAAKAAVIEYLEENEMLPPGVERTVWKEVQIRRN